MGYDGRVNYLGFYMESSPPRRLTRSRTDRFIAGVCGGLGTYTGLDSTILRLVFVIFTLCGGSGILLYILMVILVPLENDERQP